MVISALVAVMITLGWGLWLVRDNKKGGGLIMANDTVFIIMCTFVSLIAMSGGLFFYLQDKERKRRHIN